MQIVIRTGVLRRLQRLLVPVVDDLILRRHMPHHVVALGDAVEDAGVAVRFDLPFERQLEIGDLAGRDDVAGLADARERAVDAPPATRPRPLPTPPPPPPPLPPPPAHP